MTGFGLCRVCDTALQDTDVKYLTMWRGNAVFRVVCPSGGCTYFADETNSLTGYPGLDELPSVLQEGDPSSSSLNGGSDSPSGS